MNEFTSSVSSGLSTFMNFLPTLIGAILLFIIAWIVAKLVKKGSSKGLKAVGFNRLLTKWGATQNTEQANQTIDAIANVLYYLVWLLFLPAILGMLGLTAVADPISNMFTTALNFLPKLVGAILIFAIGYVVAKFVKNMVYNLLLSVNLDKWMSKVTPSNQNKDVPADQKGTLAKVLANLVFIIILIPIVTAALDTLGIAAISRPVIGVLNTILAAIPNILVAVILLGIGFMIAKFVGDLLADLLKGTGVNNVMKYMNMNGKMNFDLSKIIGQIVAVVIGVFFLVEALNVLNLQVLNNIGAAIISYLPLVLSAVLILGLGIIGGTMLGNFISKSADSQMLGDIVKYILIIFSVFMALDQLQFAQSIVNGAFLFIMGGIAIAFAIAFGIGGRDVAKRTLEKAEKKTKEEASSSDNNRPTV
ncbi:mechanosensitive ion channel [Pisciglobus halotolerans]|uniref:Conserved TM helix n=1 Tax=Pisciglobus halotolerans TaxID=745365 RepID=A0A1I3D2E3_9LACT|nr:mechanosensitive ion channel [Pisciglobus halotolerans]SFH80867.1 Conserved TM helix [Pisciglobus halotolerans]